VAVLLLLSGCIIVAGGAVTFLLVGCLLVAVLARWALRTARSRGWAPAADVVPMAAAVDREVRGMSVDELERRDPAGFARWLSEGATVDSDPARYVSGDPAAGYDAA
jgi:hypothetical protein